MVGWIWVVRKKERRNRKDVLRKRLNFLPCEMWTNLAIQKLAKARRSFEGISER